MAQLWGGRFIEATDDQVYQFNASIRFDQRFFREDIEGSMAHAAMLEKQGILLPAEKDTILSGLHEILAEVQNGSLIISDEYEDIHSFVEANLIAKIGDAGKKLHTGRSRNDQVALDMKLYTRTRLLEINRLVFRLLETLDRMMQEHIDTYMPALPICRKRSLLRLRCILALILKCFDEISCV